MIDSLLNESALPYQSSRANDSWLTKKAVEEDIEVNLSTASTAIVTCFLCIVIIITVLGNSAALAAFSIYRPLRTVTNYFLINLCISDITVATICMPFWISYILTGWPSVLNGGVYTFWVCLDTFCGTWSIMSLAMISIERYICVGFPLYYQNLVTRRRTLIMIAFVLFYSTIASLLGYAQFFSPSPNLSMSIFALSFVVPVIIKSYTYWKIYKEAKKQQKFINQEEKDRIRLLEQKHLFSVRKLSDEESPSTQADKKMASDLNDRCLESSKGEAVVIPSGDQHGDDFAFDSEERYIDTCMSRVLACYSPSDHHANSTTTILKSERNISRGRLSCCCCKKDVENQSPKSRLTSSGDVEVTYESSGLSSADKCSSDSFKRLKKLGIEDWNAYLDELEGLQEPVVEVAPATKEIAKKCLSKEELCDGCTIEVCKPLTGKSPLLPIKSCNTYSMRVDAKQNSKENKQVATTYVDTVSKQMSKRQPSGFPRVRAVKFIKSESTVELKQKGLSRFKRLQREVKASKVIGRIIGTFLILWTPFMVVVFMSSLGIEVSMKTVIAAKCLHYANSAINPILYVIFNKNFKKALSRLLRMYYRNNDR